MPDAAAGVELVGAGTATVGYSPVLYEAFWGAGYTSADATALAQVWSIDEVQAKARAGQVLLDGDALPVAPGATPTTAAQDADPLWTAFAGAGYTYQDALAVATLWATDVDTAKAGIGRAVLAGQSVPVPPSGAPVTD